MCSSRRDTSKRIEEFAAAEGTPARGFKSLHQQKGHQQEDSRVCRSRRDTSKRIGEFAAAEGTPARGLKSLQQQKG
jgi:hypothetical protein